MIDVDIDKLKILLKLDGVDISDFSDDELEILVESKIVELESLLGVKIRPFDKSEIRGKFKGRVLELGDYPILDIADIFVNDKFFPYKKYNVNYELGIIYFEHFIVGNVRVEYTVGLDEIDFDYLIFPLLKDMIGYGIEHAKINSKYGGLNKVASSLKEGDVSVNFSSTNFSGVGAYGYDGGINNRIDELKKRFSYRARVMWL